MEILFFGVAEEKPVLLNPIYRSGKLTTGYCQNLLKTKEFAVLPAFDNDYVVICARGRIPPIQGNVLAQKYTRHSVLGHAIYMPLSVFQDMD